MHFRTFALCILTQLLGPCLFVIIKLSCVNSFPTGDEFYSLLITFANSLDPDQARQSVHIFLALILVFIKSFLKTFSGMADSVDPDQTALGAV